MVQDGFVLRIADNLYIGGEDEQQLISNWNEVLKRIDLNNLKLSATKTEICPKETEILGWVWSYGRLSPSEHKLSPLSMCEIPKTIKQLRSYIRAFKVISRCIPRYSLILSPVFFYDDSPIQFKFKSDVTMTSFRKTTL